MKAIKGVVVFFGFTVALFLVVIGYGMRQHHPEHYAAYVIAEVAGLGLFYILYRLTNSS